MARYDKLYEEEHHFGNPYPDLVKFFMEQNRRGSVLDLGCGQGRDALALAHLGYDVTGVDVSEVGIRQMLSEAQRNSLNVKGIIADAYEFPIDASFDYVLLDSFLHFYKPKREREIKLVQRIMDEMRIDAILCIFVGKSKTTEPILESIFKKESSQWKVLEDKYIRYPKMNSMYRMFIVKKQE